MPTSMSMTNQNTYIKHAVATQPDDAVQVDGRFCENKDQIVHKTAK